MGVGIRACVVAGFAAMLGCASGGGQFDDAPGPGFGEDAGTTDGSSATSKFDSHGESDETTTGGVVGDEAPLPPDLGACADDGDCVIDDGSCFEPFGACVDGSCTFAPKLAGVPCDDADPCTDQDVCNGVGGCLGAVVGCEVPNGLGTCNAGMCVDIQCAEGWGDCNMQDADGCETALDSPSDCGECGRACSAGEHGSAACVAGECTLSCDAPWEDCDGDPANGCEIPTGVANQCDANGLDPVNGCWTAHCGTSNNPDARNFGTWYCFECTTCNVPASGQCRWCDHSTGNWYPQEACACGSYEDLVCNP